MRKITKKNMGLWQNYCNAYHSDLSGVYRNPSEYKRAALCYIQREMVGRAGYDLRITGHNCMAFSCAYRYKDGNIERLRYHTAQNIYDFECPGQ